MKIFKVINVELGWDNVMCVADSMEAVAYYLECKTLEELEERIKADDLRVYEEELETLPKDCKTLKEAVEKYW